MGEAATILRSARRAAGLSVRQLAGASGVAESRISDYEHGRHQPSAAMLDRLLRATGRELESVPLRRADPVRNSRMLADVLSLVDAVPFGEMRGRGGRKRPSPPRWRDLVQDERAGG